MSKIKIYLDTLVFGLQKIGGVSVVWYEYVKRMLNDEEINLTLLDINSDYVNFLFNSLDTSKVRHEKEKGQNLQLLRNKSPKIVSDDIALFQSTYLRTCKNKNIKNVIMIHDITHQLYFKGIKRILNTYQKKKAIKNADGIIYVSENTKRDVERFFPQSRKINSVVIYNSASEYYKPLKDVVIPERYSVLVGRKYFIYVGDRYPYKNTDILFDILNCQKDITAVFIGGKPFSKEEMKKQEQYKDRIYRFEKVPDVDLNILYNAAFCMIYPSLYEGFGIPVLEAMKAGCPVIAFNNSAIPEVIIGSGILLENNNFKGMIDALKKLSDDYKREEIRLKELKVAEYFKWDVSYRKLIEFYESVL